jgi:hypothetical protein
VAAVLVLLLLVVVVVDTTGVVLVVEVVLWSSSIVKENENIILENNTNTTKDRLHLTDVVGVMKTWEEEEEGIRLMGLTHYHRHHVVVDIVWNLEKVMKLVILVGNILFQNSSNCGKGDLPLLVRAEGVGGLLLLLLLQGEQEVQQPCLLLLPELHHVLYSHLLPRLQQLEIQEQKANRAILQ